MPPRAGNRYGREAIDRVGPDLYTPDVPSCGTCNRRGARDDGIMEGVVP